MRELAVYYCPGCGHYGFYQAASNIVCPLCCCSMTRLPMSYQNFMDLEVDMRDSIIANLLAEDVLPSSSVVQRITELEKDCTDRFTVLRLKEQARKLEAENETLHAKVEEQEHTISWMHDMIWDLAARIKGK